MHEASSAKWLTMVTATLPPNVLPAWSNVGMVPYFLILPLSLLLLLAGAGTALADGAPPPFVELTPVRASGLRSVDRSWASTGRDCVAVHLLRTTGLSWVSAGKPVTYSVTIGDLAAGTAFLRLIGGTTPIELANRTLASNVICLQIDRLADGTAVANLRFKVNSTNTDALVVATLKAPRPVGAWRLTLDGTKATIIAPDDRTQSATFDLGAIVQFADPISVYVGGGQGNVYPPMDLTLSRISITGIPDPVEETFAGEALDRSRWEHSGNVAILVPKNARLWLSSPSLFYPRYPLQTSTSLTAAVWTDFPVNTNSLLPHSWRYVSMTPIPLDTNGSLFFRTFQISSPFFPPNP